MIRPAMPIENMYRKESPHGTVLVLRRLIPASVGTLFRSVVGMTVGVNMLQGKEPHF